MERVLTVVAWVWIVALGSLLFLSRGVLPASSLDAKLFGPGKTAPACYGRAVRNFPAIEAELTQIAEAMVASGDIDTVVYSLDDRFLKGVDALAYRRQGREVRDLKSDEWRALTHPAARMYERGSIYAPMIFTRTDDGSGIVAHHPVACGVRPGEWLSMRLLGVDPYELRTRDAEAYETQFVYRPAQPAEACGRARPTAYGMECAVRLDDNWNWRVARWDLAASAAEVAKLEKSVPPTED